MHRVPMVHRAMHNTNDSTHPLVAELARLDDAVSGLTSQIATLEERVRGGDKGAYRACKFHRLQLGKLRTERNELERRLRRNGHLPRHHGA
jgi:hypothetical protein